MSSDSPAAILFDANGNPLTSTLHGASRCLDVASTQNVMASTGNNSTANLGAGATYVGTGESTLGIAGIQVNFIADQSCLIQVQQSMDNIWWDVEDQWTQDADQGDGRTIQATASYFRVLVTNQGGSTTTYLRLQTALCPVVEVVPRSLTQYGSLKVAVREQQMFSDCFENKLFSSTYEGIVADTETPFIWFRNPLANTKDLIAYKMITMALKYTQGVITRVYLNPTVTATIGSVAIGNRNRKGTPVASTMVAYYGLTTTSNGIHIFTIINGIDTNSLIDDLLASFILGPGNDILVTMEASAVNTKVALTFVWGEH